MFKLKTVGAVTLASLLLLSGCSSNNPEDEIEPVNNTLPYDSRTVRALACDVSYLISDINSEVEDYADSVVAELLTSFGLSNCAEVLSGDNLPQGYLTLEDFRGMADTRLAQME